jgi:tetratricopeptide (TPR) repeat protein
MSPAVRSSIVIAALFALIIVASVLFSRRVGDVPAPAESPEVEPIADQGRPSHPEMRQGLAALLQDRLDAAQEHFSRVPPGDPAYPSALKNLVVVEVRRGDLAAAAARAEALLALDPGDPQMLDQLSWIYYRLERLEQAELLALRAFEADPLNPALRYRVGLYRVAQGRAAEALPTYKRAMQHDLDRAAVNRALTNLMRLHDEQPDLAGVHYALAYFANAMGRPAVEVEELEHFLDREPSGNVADVARARLADARAALP